MEILKIVKFLLFQKKSKTGEWLKTYFNHSIYDIYFLNREFLRTNWFIFQSAASCTKAVPPPLTHIIEEFIITHKCAPPSISTVSVHLYQGNTVRLSHQV